MDYNKTFNKYLKRECSYSYSQVESSLKLKTYQTFIVIPCYAELDYLFQTLDSINNQDIKSLKSCLVVIVINNSKSDSIEIIDNNQKTYDSLKSKKYNFELLIIDCFSQKHALDSKIAGVGMARKIGLDYCIQLAENKKSLLCSLDADTIIHPDYLEHIKLKFDKEKFGACVVNFKHQKSKDLMIENGIRKYEKILKSIAENISSAGSPYGYVSLGSTIVCTVKSYVACGGMSKKKATEDFYFLQALAKYTEIKKFKKILVHPSSRDNQRVYLGTGFRMKEYKKTNDFKDLQYSNESYQSLKDFISIINLSWNDKYNVFYEKLMQTSNKKTVDFLIEKKIEHVWYKMQQNAKNKNQFMLFFHQWFDALMIIQLLKKLNN